MGIMESRTATILTPPLTIQYATPVTTDTIVISAATDALIVEPAGTIAALTVTLPTTASPGKVIRIASTQIVTVLTLGAGASTIVGALTAFTASGFAAYIYRSAKWYRCG